MKNCPRCSLLSPDAAIMCDCGHAFDQQASIRARLNGFEPLIEKRKAASIPLRIHWLGAFCGGFPVTALIVLLRANGHPANEGLQLLGLATTVAGILVARRLYEARHFKPGP